MQKNNFIQVPVVYCDVKMFSNSSSPCFEGQEGSRASQPRGKNELFTPQFHILGGNKGERDFNTYPLENLVGSDDRRDFISKMSNVLVVHLESIKRARYCF